WGLGDHADVMLSNSPTFRLTNGAAEAGARRVAWFDTPTPLRSGWAWGQQHLEGGAAVVDARVGRGRLALFGPQVLFRGQPHGTFRFVFNGIVQSVVPRE
ncbi:MAG TPA: peptidase, partial [Urbifossiella sp.]|nr:peptidase [Urbifossiella sp.]